MSYVKYLKFIYIVVVIATISALTGCAAVVLGGAATGAAVVHDRRNATVVLEDKEIEVRALKMLTEIKHGSDTRIRVVPVSYNNHLLLLGQVPDEFTRNKIVSRMRTIEKVLDVTNELALNDPLSFSVRNNDTWITTRVKGEMMLSKIVDPTRIKVVTEDSVVYLIGIVHELEGQEAAATALKVPGVDRVVKLFEPL
jgi:osmotically-inducible protein OsmY